MSVEALSAHIREQYLSLVEVGINQGTGGLEERLRSALDSIGLGEDEIVLRAIDLAKDLHKDQKRTYEPYVNHVLRVTLRLIEDLGVDDSTTIIAALLHDSIEDQAKELASRKTKEVPKDKTLRRELAHKALVLYFNEEVANIVLEGSNPLYLPDITREEKREAYQAHVYTLMTTGSAAARAIKLADFLDNAADAPIEREEIEKRHRLDQKQLGLYALMGRELSRQDTLVSEEKGELIGEVLYKGNQAAEQRLEALDESNSIRIYYQIPKPRSHPAVTIAV